MRFDIQFMRGVAVLLVLACHAFPKAVPFGYLGVDIFFVISGFLMTKMIVGGLDRGDFTFGGFYLRRARRLLPAAFVTLAVSTALAPIFLSPSDWSAYLVSLAASLTFTANLIRPEAFVHPLAHVWSLSLEEQFYFIYPLLLVLMPTQRRLGWLSMFTAASFILWLVAPRELAFYLLPCRAWELLAGALIYFAPFSVPDTWLPRSVPTSAVAKVGDWSYSLYLIHWPLLAFAAAWYRSNPPAPIAAALSLLSIALAALQYRFVEQPWRTLSGQSHKAVNLAAVPVAAASGSHTDSVERAG